MTRPFNDGGILDNSLFSFAIANLPFRRSQLPVDRKLIYVEFDLEHPENRERNEYQKPNALQNAWLSLSTLPSYQTMRCDLQTLIERNQLIIRVNRITLGLERDEKLRFAGCEAGRAAI